MPDNLDFKWAGCLLLVPLYCIGGITLTISLLVSLLDTELVHLDEAQVPLPGCVLSTLHI